MGAFGTSRADLRAKRVAEATAAVRRFHGGTVISRETLEFAIAEAVGVDGRVGSGFRVVRGLSFALLNDGVVRDCFGDRRSFAVTEGKPEDPEAYKPCPFGTDRIERD